MMNWSPMILFGNDNNSEKVMEQDNQSSNDNNNNSYVYQIPLRKKLQEKLKDLKEYLIDLKEITNQEKINLFKKQYPELFINNKLKLSLPTEAMFTKEIQTILFIANNIHRAYGFSKTKAMEIFNKALKNFPEYSAEILYGPLNPYGADRVKSSEFMSGVIKKNNKIIMNFYMFFNHCELEYKITENININLYYKQNKIIFFEYMINDVVVESFDENNINNYFNPSILFLKNFPDDYINNGPVDNIFINNFDGYCNDIDSKTIYQLLEPTEKILSKILTNEKVNKNLLDEALQLLNYPSEELIEYLKNSPSNLLINKYINFFELDEIPEKLKYVSYDVNIETSKNNSDINNLKFFKNLQIKHPEIFRNNKITIPLLALDLFDENLQQLIFNLHYIQQQEFYNTEQKPSKIFKNLLQNQEYTIDFHNYSYNSYGTIKKNNKSILFFYYGDCDQFYLYYKINDSIDIQLSIDCFYINCPESQLFISDIIIYKNKKKLLTLKRYDCNKELICKIKNKWLELKIIGNNFEKFMDEIKNLEKLFTTIKNKTTIHYEKK